MGKLVVFEGIDGSGKSTQLKILRERLEYEGREFTVLSFPQYDEPSSALIRMYLGGEFGSEADSVNPYAASTFYAVDRFASYMMKWREPYNNGRLILADRYTTSNAVHQGSKLTDRERISFFKWITEFEYEKIGLPEPSAVIYMDIPVDVAVRQMRKREMQTNTRADIHERDMEYLKSCALCGSDAADYFGWHRVRCCMENGEMKPADEINDDIYDYLKNGGLI